MIPITTIVSTNDRPLFDEQGPTRLPERLMSLRVRKLLQVGQMG